MSCFLNTLEPFQIWLASLIGQENTINIASDDRGEERREMEGEREGKRNGAIIKEYWNQSGFKWSHWKEENY